MHIKQAINMTSGAYDGNIFQCKLKQTIHKEMLNLQLDGRNKEEGSLFKEDLIKWFTVLYSLITNNLGFKSI